MKRKIGIITTCTVIITSLFAGALRTPAQGGPNHVPNTKSQILYHGGRIMIGSSNTYFIWYGCWTNNCGSNGSADTANMVGEFVGNIGSTPYFAINTSYPNDAGQAPGGSLPVGGLSFDPNYSHGVELTAEDIQAIVRDQILGGQLPSDPAGIYVVVASADVGSSATGFCTTVGTPPHHGISIVSGTGEKYAFLGDPKRCPAIAGPQFIAANGNQLPTPNNDFAADVLAADLAHVLNTIVTDPQGNGWYDRYGFENADKCQGTFGTTFTTPNGARANVTWGGRNYLVEQNWINDKKGHCGMQLFQF